MAASQADIEEFLAVPLVSWLATCVKNPDSLQVYETFFDGGPISEVLLLIDPEPSQPIPTSSTSLQGLSITATRIRIFHCIVKNIKSLYEEELGQVVVSLPNCVNLGRTPASQTALEQLRLLLLLLLGCAVQGPTKEYFITRIRELPLDIQRDIVDCIKQGRHMPGGMHGSLLHHNLLYRSLQEDAGLQYTPDHDGLEEAEDEIGLLHTSLPAQPGISRQQLINSPCPICGDKIYGFHYGIFSCKSCKSFFKRTLQDRKNYIGLRGAACPVTVATRKKCPACRFDKCLKCGMKRDAVREDRTRGGQSNQCSYSLPPSLASHPELRASATDLRQGYDPPQQDLRVKLEPSDSSMYMQSSTPTNSRLGVPPLLQEPTPAKE